jgi:hypothetical protein
VQGWGQANMPKKKRMRTMKTKTTRVRKASPRTGLKGNTEDKKWLPLTDYLLEEHPELGFPVDRALTGKSET